MLSNTKDCVKSALNMRACLTSEKTFDMIYNYINTTEFVLVVFLVVLEKYTDKILEELIKVFSKYLIMIG